MINKSKLLTYVGTGMAMVIAGLCEFILGNTFPFVVFLLCKWL
jgi:succinate-acetate transporter protein